ncbi:SpoIIE family protein phosphatase [Verrucomicrobiaceae bacterium N1E253]|uniref:SpoIIE family protein phosphatase n=1 Tax=Oceaniferula marina TaxID=2748318 RepID=A0A851GIU0_9BACT|nr:SpoIIE family protein phosphatase [Oceaniferula marina]NWK55115.1 SpoIIE family protein phosphatase [Oceaniferula marina]
MKTDSRDRLNLALRASNEGVWDWYVGDKDIYYSDRALEFLGYDAQAAPNLAIDAKKYLHPDDLESFETSFEQALTPNNNDLLAVDLRYRHPDGSWRWFRVRGIVIRDYNQKAIRIVGSVIDISKRKNAETALEEERHRLKQLVENIPVNIYYKDTDSRFVLSNSSTAEKLGAASVQDLLGKSDYDFFDASHADIARQNELEIMQSLEPQINVIQCETWEGKDDTWAETSKLPWLDHKGNVQGIFGITSDITKLVKTQRKLARVANELHHRNQAIEEELKLAREIQQALLPLGLDEHTLRGYDREISFDCRYAPASDLAGDFFEIIPISQHKTGILICDVMGHGVRSSLVVSMLRGLMEKERDAATSPEWFLYGINDGLVSILERANVTLFATAIYCVVNLKKATLTYSCAGHPAPIIIKDGKARQVPMNSGKGNPALGLIAKTPYTSKTIPLDELDRLLLFTDGLYEVENENNEAFGIEHILQSLQASSSEKLGNSLDTLLASARLHSKDGEFDDDVCLLAMDVH